jgi:threonine synthase
MSYVRCVRGLVSGIEYSADAPMNLDPADGRPVEMVLDLERLAAEQPNASWYDPTRRDMWRFGALMALDVRHPRDAAHIVALGEGCTPVLDYSSHPVALAAGLRLGVKDEGRAHPGFGANPTQSFKDRGMAMVVAQVRRLGLTRLAVPTQGNAGDSLVHYALAAGLSVVVAMPEDTPAPILGNVAAAALRFPERVKLELVGPTIREAAALLKERYVRAFDSGALDTTPQPGPSTIAFGLNVPAGVGHFRVLEIVRASGGACVAEAEIAAELGRVRRRTHGWLSPEGAACLAALPQLLERGLVNRGERVVAVNTGSAEKYLPSAQAAQLAAGARPLIAP